MACWCRAAFGWKAASNNPLPWLPNRGPILHGLWCTVAKLITVLSFAGMVCNVSPRAVVCIVCKTQPLDQFDAERFLVEPGWTRPGLSTFRLPTELRIGISWISMRPRRQQKSKRSRKAFCRTTGAASPWTACWASGSPTVAGVM